MSQTSEHDFIDSGMSFTILNLTDDEPVYPDENVWDMPEGRFPEEDEQEKLYKQQYVPSWPKLFGFPDGYVKCWTWTCKLENPYV